MTAWPTTRCSRCLDVIETGRVHECGPNESHASSHPVRHVVYNDPATLRAMAERWDRPGSPDAVVVLPPRGSVGVGYLLRLVADAMEEAE